MVDERILGPEIDLLHLQDENRSAWREPLVFLELCIMKLP